MQISVRMSVVGASTVAVEALVKSAVAKHLALHSADILRVEVQGHGVALEDSRAFSCTVRVAGRIGTATSHALQPSLQQALDHALNELSSQLPNLRPTEVIASAKHQPQEIVRKD